MQPGLVKFSDLFEIEKGALQSSKCTAGEYDFITASSERKTHNSYTHECEALVIAVAASGSLGRVHYANGKFIASDLCFILTPKLGIKLDLRLYCHYLNSIRETLVGATATGTSKKAINLGNLSKFPIPYISYDRQVIEREIIDFCLTRNKAIDTKNVDNLSLTKHLRTAILQIAMQGKIVPQNSSDEPVSELLKKIQLAKHDRGKALKKITSVEIPYSIPDNWAWCRICDHIKVTGGSQPNKGVFIHEPREGYTRFIQIRDFKSDGYKTYIPTTMANRPFSEDDVMIGRYGPPVFQILRGLKGTYNVALMKAEPRYESITKDFIFYLLQEPRIQNIVITESERTAGQTGIRLPLLNDIVFPLPPLAEQKRIVAKVDELMTLCDQLEAHVTHTQTLNTHLMDSLIHRMTEAA